MDRLFREGPRTDLTAMSYNEPLYEFLNRSGEPLVADVRQLMTGWLWATPGILEALIPGRMQGHGGTEEVPG